MKKLFLIICFSIINLIGFSQNLAPNSRNIQNSTVARLYNVIAYHETLDFYNKSRGLDDFKRNVNATIFPNGKSPAFFDKYLNDVYVFHSKKMSWNDVYDYQNGDNALVMFNSAASLCKNCKSKDEVAMTLCNNGSGSDNPNRSFGSWFNLLRKLIDVIDDFINGK